MGPAYPHDRVEGLTTCNSGIMLYKKGVAYDGFLRMKQLYQDMRGTFKTRRMDFYLTMALAEMDVLTHRMPNIFNARIGSKMCLNGKVKILHSAGMSPLSAEEYEWIGARMNQTEKARFWDGNDIV